MQKDFRPYFRGQKAGMHHCICVLSGSVRNPAVTCLPESQSTDQKRLSISDAGQVAALQFSANVGLPPKLLAWIIPWPCWNRQKKLIRKQSGAARTSVHGDHRVEST